MLLEIDTYQIKSSSPLRLFSTMSCVSKSKTANVQPGAIDIRIKNDLRSKEDISETSKCQPSQLSEEYASRVQEHSIFG